MTAALGSERIWRTSDWYVVRARRDAVLLGGAALAIASAYAAAIVLTGGDPRLLVPPAAILMVLAVCVHPVVGLYLVFGAALLFEQFPIPGLTPLTSQAPIYQNLSQFTPIPLRLSLLDLLILLTYASWFARRLAGERLGARMGPFGWPVLLYLSVFAVGMVIGAARGGAWDPVVALNEIREPAHVCLMYFLAANLVRDRTQLTAVLAVFMALVGVKALQGVGNYGESLKLAYDLDAVTSHEDVVFFDVAIGLAVVAALLGIRTKLAYALFALQPVILGAELFTERRVAFIALGTIAFAITLLALAGTPRRGLVFATVGALLLGAYIVVFGQDTGALGQPIRALRSVIDPSEVGARDQLSGAWREIENRNIEYTMHQLPLTGVGLGQQYIFREEPPPLWGFTYWRYETHNAVLWLWLKAGPLGGFALWFLVARVLVLGSRWHVRLADPWLRWAAALPVLLVLTQFVFSSVELGLTYSRTMITLGTVLGLGAVIGDLGSLRPVSRER